MIAAEVSLYLISMDTIALLQKTMMFSSLPRVGEFVKLNNRQMGDYFSFSVEQVTHREDDMPTLWLHLIRKSNGTTTVDFIATEEIPEYIDSYKNEGWCLISKRPNRTFLADTPIRSDAESDHH